MVDFLTPINNTFSLLGTASFILVVAFTFASFTFSKLGLNQKKLKAKIVIGVLFGVLAIYGTVMGTKLADGTVPNVRELGAMIAGVAGGPIGGLLAGLIGGIHRYSVGGVSALPCALATILVGVIAGVVSPKLGGKMYLLKGALLGVVLESAALGLLFLLLPLDTAVSIASQVAGPMITADTIGLVLWMYLFKRWNVQH
jgi:LytS/YehU family sensor histidine kinase